MDKVDDRRLTTADLAAYRRPGSERPSDSNATDQTAPIRRTGASEDDHPFFDTAEGNTYRSRWQEIQVGFVDDPRAATEKADGLVAEVIHRLAEVFAHERGRLEGQWSRGGDVTTEDLRVALQRYRAFFDRLLSVSATLAAGVAQQASSTATTASSTAAPRTPARPQTSGPGDASRTAGTAVGAVGGAAAGAAAGSAVGPVGTAAGMAAGAVAGGAAGRGAAAALDPKEEDEYWRSHYASRPYVKEGVSYDAYRPAYQYGWESYKRYGGRRFEEVEPSLRQDWEAHSGGRTGWDRVRDAVRDAWHRVERKMPGDADRDGR